MTQSHPMDSLLDSLLSNPLLGQDLSVEDKAAVKAMVGELMGELDGLMPVPDNASPAHRKTSHPSTTPDSDPTEITELDSLLSAFGLDPTQPSTDMNANQLLEAQSNAELIETLDRHVTATSEVMEVLATRRHRGRMLEVVSHTELQLMALSIGVSDLYEALEQQTNGITDRSWKDRTRSFLLRDFRFINHFVIRLLRHL